MSTLSIKLVLAIATIAVVTELAIASKPITWDIPNQILETGQARHAIDEPYVPGIAFSRILQIWLENTNFEAAAEDNNMRWLAEQGVLLVNYYAVTHPSEPNYIAVVGGDTFGLQNDRDHRIPSNISTVVDLLETKRISWAEYQEELPTGNIQVSHADGYVRKHNPLSTYDSTSHNTTRSAQIKNFTKFEQDLADKKLPQWAFFTPNIRNDGHDTGLAFAGRWLRGWLEPLLRNEYFINETLIVVSFDETKHYDTPNRVFTVLLGGAVHPSLHGTRDSMYYNHYSTLSTVSVNWDLPSLGRWDCDANVFSLVANRAGYKNTNISYQGLFWNTSYPGPLNDKEQIPGWWPRPDTKAKCAAGRGVLESVKSTWGTSEGSYNYTNVYPYDNNYYATKGGTPAVGENDASSSITPSETAQSHSGSTGGSRNIGSLREIPALSLALLLVGLIMA
ncbi:phosphoesterase family-domain-containing protein [Dactylonectria estremocensis]|uniref:Phosphoesterase family-domain-containing protein n=1 Tax=Dactylonectria estremocensis TaxID=1079267 RepID=A0A9P9IZL6_9HYPO|nr:phosphoesterase family-domain-containing protein [Dactylonectria estremocensis]